MTTRTRAGLRKVRALKPGGRVAIIAPASPLRHDDHAEFDAGVHELRRLGLDVVHDDSVFARSGYVAGPAADRAAAFERAWNDPQVDAIVALRGGYGSVQILPCLDAARLGGPSVPALVGYSDITSLHVFLGSVAGVVSVHGAMIEGRLSKGAAAYDPETWLGSLSATPLGDVPLGDGVDILRPGEAAGPFFGGTLTQLLASLGTPYAFQPPAGHVLFIDEVGERPYRLDRMLTQARLCGWLASASAVVFGELPRCDEVDGSYTARGVAADLLRDFPGPVLFGVPSGHTAQAMISLPLGVETRVVARGRPRLVVEEAAAC